MIAAHLRRLWPGRMPPCGYVRSLAGRAGQSVLLTFNDGPTPRVTEAVIERLAAHDARAVFFLVGQKVAQQPQIVRTVAAAGHVLGNHSYAHPDHGWGSPAALWRDLRCCQRLLRELAGSAPILFRPPAGKLTIASLVIPHALGLQPVLWSLDSGDCRITNEEQAVAIAHDVLDNLRAGDIVLLHDASPHILTTLDTLLPGLQARGLDLTRSAEILDPRPCASKTPEPASRPETIGTLAGPDLN